MQANISPLYADIFASEVKQRYIALWGGRGRGASYTATAYMLFLLLTRDGFRGVLLREVYSDVRASLFQDVLDHIERNPHLAGKLEIDNGKMTVTNTVSGGKLISRGFVKSAGNRTGKLKSLAGITHAVIEEADEVDEVEFQKLDESIRTTKTEVQILLLFNPPTPQHWLMRRFFVLSPSKKNKGYYVAAAKPDADIYSVHSTYRDNTDNIAPRTAALYERYAVTNPSRFAVMVKGLVSAGAQGQVYTNWSTVTLDDYHAVSAAVVVGLDWGWNDPTAAVAVKKKGRKLYVHELIYDGTSIEGQGLTNREIKQRLLDAGITRRTLIVADGSNPKDIYEFSRDGWAVTPAKKGQGSVMGGIRKVKEYEIAVTNVSKNIIFELNHYRFADASSGYASDTPVDEANHAMDALRYAVAHENKSGRIILAD